MLQHIKNSDGFFVFFFLNREIWPKTHSKNLHIKKKKLAQTQKPQNIFWVFAIPVSSFLQILLRSCSFTHSNLLFKETHNNDQKKLPVLP
jgi:hypothetical protein